jgi:hypothetical protein
MRRRGSGNEDELAHPLRPVRGQRERDHAAIGSADNGVGMGRADRVERGNQHLRLLLGRRRAPSRRVGGEVEAEHAVVRRIDDRAGADQAGPPARGAVVAVTDVAVRRNAPERDDERRRSRTAKAQAHLAAKVAQRRRQRHVMLGCASGPGQHDTDRSGASACGSSRR